MTIASEITRLQNDKAAMCAAIENKGVTVGNVTFDDYASCIDAISSGGGKSVEYLVIAGGGGGGGSSGSGCPGGGGGAGGVISGDFIVHGDSISVTVGLGGAGGNKCAEGSNGGNSCIVDTCTSLYKEAHGGGGGGSCGIGKNGGSGGGAGRNRYAASCYSPGGNALGCPGEMGSSGGTYIGSCCCGCPVGGGGGGATGSGNTNAVFLYASCSCNIAPGNGGMGLEGTRGGKTICYAGGGGAGKGGTMNFGHGKSGGGEGGCCSTTCNGGNATTCGSGGGGASNRTTNCIGVGGNGAGGLVILGYNCVCKDCNGFTCATGGDSCYVCDNIKYHCFTSSGTFTIVS